MSEPPPPRHLNIARARWAELAASIFAAAIFGGFALLMFRWALDGFSEEADQASAITTFVLALCFAFAFAFGCGVFGVMAVGRLLRWRKPVDLDASELVIPRKKWRRVPFTLANLVVASGVTILLLAAIGQGNTVGIVFWLLFLLSAILSIWRIWRNPARTHAPVVLNIEGIEDRSLDRPRIPWRDIAEIDKRWGLITLTGETAQRIAATTPDRRLLQRWLKRPQPKYGIDLGGLEPDETYARALIRAYWLRRVARDADTKR